MKGIFLSILISLIIVSSCKKKKDDACITNVTSIAGTYKLVSLKYKLVVVQNQKELVL